MDLSKIDNDFSDKEVEVINTFVKNGCIGLETLSKEEHKINNMYGLYMAGKTYIEISKITKTKKNLVLYMSAKMKWYEKRMEYLEDIQSAMTEKLASTRIQSMNFIADLINFHHKFYGDKINRYMGDGDASHIEDVDLKALTPYFKSIEMLEKILNPANVDPKNPGSKGTIKMNAAGDESIEATVVEQGAVGDVLKALAKLKDEQKKENQ